MLLAILTIPFILLPSKSNGAVSGVLLEILKAEMLLLRKQKTIKIKGIFLVKMFQKQKKF